MGGFPVANLPARDRVDRSLTPPEALARPAVGQMDCLRGRDHVGGSAGRATEAPHVHAPDPVPPLPAGVKVQ